MIGVVVTAAGSSQRLGSGASKVLLALAGRTVLERALDAVRAGLPDAALVVTTRAEDLGRVRALAGGASVVTGGATRQASVARGLAALPAQVTHVLVHDAARPLASPALFRAVAAAVEAHGAAAAVVPPNDTLHELGAPDAPLLARALDRRLLRAAQTPQGARRDWLEGAFARAEAAGLEATDEVGLLLSAGRPVHAVPGEPWNVKLTRPEDVVLLEALLAGLGARPLDPPSRDPGRP